MRRIFAVAGLAGAIGAIALSFAILPSASTQAASTSTTFTIPGNDGYGIGECMSSGSSSCARVVADAWCEAQGFAKSAKIDVAMVEVETTASISPSSRGPISITCAE